MPNTNWLWCNTNTLKWIICFEKLVVEQFSLTNCVREMGFSRILVFWNGFRWIFLPLPWFSGIFLQCVFCKHVEPRWIKNLVDFLFFLPSHDAGFGTAMLSHGNKWSRSKIYKSGRRNKADAVFGRIVVFWLNRTSDFLNCLIFQVFFTCFKLFEHTCCIQSCRKHDGGGRTRLKECDFAIVTMVVSVSSQFSFIFYIEWGGRCAECWHIENEIAARIAYKGAEFAKVCALK